MSTEFTSREGDIVMRIANAIHWKLQADAMPSDRIEQDLERRALERINQGRLPAPGHQRTWGGRGSHEPCALCDVTIRSDEVEYEIETRNAAGVQLYRFHFLCHNAWQYACEESA
jgi:hypothetical protein